MHSRRNRTHTRCIDCREWKPLTDFSPSRQQRAQRGQRVECRACATLRSAKHRPLVILQRSQGAMRR